MQRRCHAALALVITALAASVSLLPSEARAAPSDPSARLPCVFFNPNLGEYGAEVFRLLRRPGRCTEFRGNKPCHCTESPLTGIHWRNWGSEVATATAEWHYCGSGSCTYRPARLTAHRVRDRCGPVYTRLRMRLPRHRLHGHALPVYRDEFRLPACGGPFDYI
jgi:hypothetical protein